MAGRTGRCGVIVFTNNPLGVAKIHLALVGVESDTVLGLFINLDMRVIGTHVALAAVLGVARLFD